MNINSNRFGEIECKEKDLLHIPDGLIGFPDSKKYVLFDHKKDSPFRWLQSADEPDLAFVVIDPLLIVPDYPLDQLRDHLAKDADRPESLAVAAIVTVPPAPTPITVNLLAPLAFNAQTHIGAQIVLRDERFSSRHIIEREEESQNPKELEEEMSQSEKK